MNGKQSATLVIAAMALAACAINTEPVDFTSFPGTEIVMTQTLSVGPTQYKHTLAKDSRWKKVGTVPQGDVYRPVGTVFTIEDSNMHEAYLVLTNTHALVGFYLPGELSLSKLSAPVQLFIKENP